MARKSSTIERDECGARQRAIDIQRRRLDKIRKEARREGEVAAAFRGEKQRRAARDTALRLNRQQDTRATRRFYADLLEIVKLPCGRQPDAMVLANLARYRGAWLRPLSAWRPAGDTHLEQQASLLRHLLVQYCVPAFLYRAWYLDDLTEGREYRNWFLRMTGGENIRACSPPIRLTHRAAYLFLQAPDECTIVGAMRRAQYLAMGGSVAGATELLDTVLGYAQPDEPFWETALLFIADHEREMRPGQIAMLAGYFHWRASDRARGPAPGEAPALPLSFKGRALSNLLRDAEAYWQLRPMLAGSVIWWNRSGIAEWLPDMDAANREWSIVELLNSGELRREGDAMRHCVASYQSRCVAGSTSIWSVRCREPGATIALPVMTVEIGNVSRHVVQAAGLESRRLVWRRGDGRLTRRTRKRLPPACELHVHVPCETYSVSVATTSRRNTSFPCRSASAVGSMGRP